MASISGQNTSNISGIDGFFTEQGGGGTVSTTPDITVSGGTFGIVTVTITNHSSYTNPNYFAEAKVGTMVTASDSDITRILDPSRNHIGDVLAINDTSAVSGARTLTVKAQEFGDSIQSTGAIGAYVKADIQNRYIRVRGVTSAGAETSSRLAINDIRFCSASSGGGTRYPTTNLTSNTSETGIVVSAGHSYSSNYAPWKACDNPRNRGTMWWALSTTAANNWWQIHFESGTYTTIPVIKSLRVYFNAQTDATHFSLEGSDNGNFSGEETNYGVFEIIENTQQILG
tara:strand:- start:183 stop:1040 length:858 start_codon:yes stop_codon:yes gene_type:complete